MRLTPKWNEVGHLGLVTVAENDVMDMVWERVWDEPIRTSDQFSAIIGNLLSACFGGSEDHDKDIEDAWRAVMSGTISNGQEAIAWMRNRLGYCDD